MTNQPGKHDFDGSDPRDGQRERAGRKVRGGRRERDELGPQGGVGRDSRSGVTEPATPEPTRRQALGNKWRAKTRGPGVLIALGGLIILLGTPFAWLKSTDGELTRNGLGTVDGTSAGAHLDSGFGTSQIVLVLGVTIVAAGLLRAVGLLTRPMAVIGLLFAIFALGATYIDHQANVTDTSNLQAGLGMWMAFVGSAIAIAVGLYGAIKR